MATLPNFVRHWWNGLSRSWSRARHPFDRAHGVDTDGLIYADPPQNRHNAGYYATAPSLFHGAIALWRATLASTGCAIEDYALIDIGCGKGRVVMLATGYPFRSITGVELNPQLARIARRNLRKWTRRAPQQWVPQVPDVGTWEAKPPIRIIEADALDLALPGTPVVLFYFNSFEREMTGLWLSRLAGHALTRTAPLDLIYIHPEHDALVRQVPAIRPLTLADIPFSPEDAASDAFSVASDQCAVYRIPKPEQLPRL